MPGVCGQGSGEEGVPEHWHKRWSAHPERLAKRHQSGMALA
jgi:hypothetical protein